MLIFNKLQNISACNFLYYRTARLKNKCRYKSSLYQRTETGYFRNRVYIFNPFGRFSSLTDSPGRPITIWSAMKLPVGLRSSAGLRIRGTSRYAMESSRLCSHLACISLESSTISRLSFTRSMVHFSSL